MASQVVATRDGNKLNFANVRREFPSRSCGDRRAVAACRAGDTELGECLLDWNDVRATSDRRRTAVNFGLSLIGHACTVYRWIRPWPQTPRAALPPVT